MKVWRCSSGRVRGPHFYDLDGRLCLILGPVAFGELLSTAFDMLRHASCDNASVSLHMLEVIDAVGREAGSPEARKELSRHDSLIQAETQTGRLIEDDRQLIQRSRVFSTEYKNLGLDPFDMYLQCYRHNPLRR